MSKPNPQAAYRRQLWTLLLPYLAGASVLVAAPALISLALAFSDYDALSAPNWTGLSNFRYLRADIRFPIALRNSLHFIGLAVPLRLLGAL